MDEKTLLILRNEINSLDIEIISLLESRLQISKEIGVIKRKIKKDFFDKTENMKTIIVSGVNGVGKTTTIGKISKILMQIFI